MNTPATDVASTQPERPDVDALLVRSIGRWASIVALLLFLYDLAILRNWPFPRAIDMLRAPFYIAMGTALLLATAAITFLGYRIVTMRVATRPRSLFFVFLPAAVLVSTVIAFLLLTAPR